MNLKKIISLSLALVMLLSVGASAKTLEFTMGVNTMYESSDKIASYELENAPYTKNDRTMVPVRIISERFGATVDWDPEKSEVIIVKGDKTIILTLGKAEALVNGETVALDVAPEEFNGRTMVPLRFVSETLNMDVDYVAATEQVIITDEQPLMTVNGVDVTVDDYKSVLAYLGYDPEVDSAGEYVNFATDMFKDIYASSDYVKKSGYISQGAYNQEVKSTIEPNAQSIYKTALVSPLAKLLENDLQVVEFVYASLNTEAGAELAYEKYNSEYITAKHILISSEERGNAEAKKIAEDVLKQLQGGADFDALMAEYGEDPGAQQSPDGYTFTKNEMVKEFETAAYALEVGEISGLVESQFGYHIIKREPLAEADYYTLYATLEALASDMYDEIVETTLATAQITMHKTDSEIIEMFK